MRDTVLKMRKYFLDCMAILNAEKNADFVKVLEFFSVE